MIKRVAIIGAGNVATHLGNALKNAGIEIVCISSKHPENAAKLAEQTGAKSYGRVEDVSYDGADAIIVSVKDDSIADVLSQLPQNNAILIHTSGGVPADILAGKSERYGIIYPLQTFTKNRELDFSEIPLFIEAGDTATLDEIRELAESLSDTVTEADSTQRRMLHVAAVFACNFTNHLYDIASRIMEDARLPYSMLHPLIKETAAKAIAMPPALAQTGPAVRGDKQVMDAHLAKIKDTKLKELYVALSESIHQSAINREKDKNRNKQ